MAVTFPRFPRWLCGGGTSKDREKDPISKGSSLNPTSETVKRLPKKTKASAKKKTRRGWLGKEEDKIGNVVFPQPDDPEWSIGWVEPHGPGFKANEGENDDDGDGGFAVLVPCYKKVVDGSGNQILGVHNNLPNGFSPDGKNMEQWLSSMRKL